MTTKEEILKMSKEELRKEYYKIPVKREDVNCSYCFNCFNCSDCSYCSYCSYCFNCFNCSDCFNCFNCSDCDYCTSQKGKKYMILDVQLTKEEYEKKLEKIKKKENGE